MTKVLGVLGHSGDLETRDFACEFVVTQINNNPLPAFASHQLNSTTITHLSV